MAKKGGLGTGVDTLLRGSTRQRKKQLQQSERVETTTATALEPQNGPAGAVTDLTEAAESTAPQAKTRGKKPAASTVKAAEKTAAKTAAKKDSPVTTGSQLASGERLQELPLKKIRPGSYQPRRNFEPLALQELADSLKRQGLVQPIVVRPYAGGFEIIAGERRWRAAELAGFDVIPAIVRQLDDQSVAAMSLIENIQRKDLNALEEANALQRLKSEFGMTQEQVAESVGRSRTAVANLLRLLDLHDEVKAMLDADELDMGHARALLALEKADQPDIARQVVEGGLSVRATEALVRSQQPGANTDSKKSRKKASTVRDPDVLALERTLGDKLGASVQINQSESGGGKLEIRYNSLDELDGILEHIH